MGYIYKRGKKLWVGYTGPDGRLEQKPTGLRVGQKRKAQKLLDRIEAQIAAGKEFDEAELGPVTVKRYGEKWIEGRRADSIMTAGDDEARLRLHVNPTLGQLKMVDVRTRHIRDLVKKLRRNGKLAPRSVRHVYGVLHTMFRDANVDELIHTNPCVLKRTDLPKKKDKDPTWRANAVFTRDETELLLSDARSPEDRRVFYALLALTGIRFGEASALRWRHYDSTLEPLGRLVIAFSYNTSKREEKDVKTEQPRLVPVHPTLAKVLAAWKLRGWQAMMGRVPKPDDLIVPSREGNNRSRHHGLKKFYQDLERLGLRRRRQHDLRRTFITLGLADGARKDVLEAMTHAPRGAIIDDYNSPPWWLLCQELVKLRITLLENQVIELPKVATVGGGQTGATQDAVSTQNHVRPLTVPLTFSEKTPQAHVIDGKKVVEAPGIEPCAMGCLQRGRGTCLPCRTWRRRRTSRSLGDAQLND